MPKFQTSFFVLLFLTVSVYAQKMLEKQYDLSAIETLVIDGNGVYEIRVIAENRETISLKATIAGDTANDVMLTKKDTERGIVFGIKYAPYFIPEDDKLAAHKVLSVILEFRIPKELQVQIDSDIGSVWGRGVFKDLSVSLARGSCFVNDFFGNATIMTLYGDIAFLVVGNVSGSGVSKNGNVNNTLLKQYRKHISAESRNGNITLTQTEN